MTRGRSSIHSLHTWSQIINWRNLNYDGNNNHSSGRCWKVTGDSLSSATACSGTVELLCELRNCTQRDASCVAAGDRTSACVGNRGHGTAHSHTPGCGQLKQRKTLLKTTVRARGGGVLQIQPCSPTFCTGVSACYCISHCRAGHGLEVADKQEP